MTTFRMPPLALGIDPCFEPVVRLPLPPSRGRIRVVELLATGTSGGAQEHVFNLVTRIDRQRYDVSVLALSNGPAVRRLERTGISVCVLDEMDDEAAIDAVAAHLAAVEADVVHNHMYRAEVVGTQAAWRLADAGRGKHRRPYVVGTVHSSRIRSDEDRELIRRLTPQMDHLIAVSRAIVRKIEDEGRDGAPVSLIYNGVDLTRYAEPDICGTLHDEFPIPIGAPIVGVVARLEPEKGHPTLIDAWPAVLAAVPNAHLLVVGEGSCREALERQVATLDIGSSVTFTGRRDDVPAVTAALDVAVLPSYREAQGLSILEAMALYRPVVASAVGGIPEMIDHGRTGLLVPPRDPAALAGSIVRLLSDHPYADTLARAGRDLVHDRFCVELMVRAVESIYDESIADERRLAAG
jgi:glycosyltransferase involved in cell wall biosynthesis